MNMRFLFAVVIALFGASCVWADLASDQATIDRYVQQGKFDMAEMLCREQLQRKLPLERRSAFTVELLRVLTERARQSTMVEADVILRKADAEAKSYLAADRQSTARWLVEFQLALLPRLRGDLRQWQMGGVRGDALHLRYLRDSLKQLQSLAKRLDAELRKTSGRERPRSNQGGLSSKALRELRNRIALELGKTYRAQAESYPAESNDRSLAAAEGQRVLDRIAPTSITPELWWRSRMEMMACLRLKSDWKASARRFEVMLADRMPPSGKAELRAEAIRIALARKKWTQAKSLAAEGEPSVDLTDPQMRIAADDLGLAYIEAYLALATHSQESGDSIAARDYESRAAAAVDARPDASPYWTRRVESLLARGSTGATGSAAGFPLTVRTARGLYRQGKLPEAAATYQRAAKQALEAGNRDEAFSLMMNAAGLLVKAEQSDEAATYLRERAIANADLTAAPAAHLLAIKLTAPQSERPDAAIATNYLRLLNEHLKWWPQGATADQVAWWRGKSREHAKKYSAALQDYLAISPAFKDRAAANLAIERCANAMASAAGDGEGGKGLAPAVTGLVAVANNGSATAAARDEAALASVRIALLGEDANVGMLSAVTALQSRVNVGGTDAARMVLAEGLFRMGRTPEAQQELAKVQAGSAEQWLRMLQSAQPPVEASGTLRAKSASWRLTLVEQGDDTVSSLSPPQRLRWDRLHVLALADSGTDQSLTKASKMIRELIKQMPKDAELRELHARLLSASEDEKQQVAAIEAWRLVISGSPPKSRRWFDAKYELARLHLKMGDKDRAGQMIELLQALHPDLGGKKQKARFVKLLKQCE